MLHLASAVESDSALPQHLFPQEPLRRVEQPPLLLHPRGQWDGRQVRRRNSAPQKTGEVHLSAEEDIHTVRGGLCAPLDQFHLTFQSDICDNSHHHLASQVAEGGWHVPLTACSLHTHAVEFTSAAWPVSVQVRQAAARNFQIPVLKTPEEHDIGVQKIKK
ncbi:hypothetical protein CEXT_388391 [Caerostris extrusa]|uniref:Uncharacterized protein n=1 Tax=Caerostris extrusa TaxID=172846 RepID=A0AAV4SLR0_CAEEX|nr:hypothetical protein CEXT_388391 [Caerostris extrusa]